jgi:lipoprotein signal peptidase
VSARVAARLYLALVVVLGSVAFGLATRTFLRQPPGADFIYLAAGPVHTGVFNVADMAITGGVLWLALSWMFRKKPA